MTAAHGLQKRFKTFRKRRTKALKANDAELIELDWEDNPSQTFDWEKELKPTLITMHTVRQSGGSVVVRVSFLLTIYFWSFPTHTNTHKQVHCAAGQSRSSTVVMAYLLSYVKIKNESKALTYAKKKRPMVKPNEGFRKILQNFHKQGLFKTLGKGVKITKSSK